MSIPSYSPRAAPTLGFLKSSANEIEIYVEDTSNRNMWLRIVRQILPVGTKLRSVNGLGGRKAVLDACRQDQADDGRRRIYIIDGDLDLITGKQKPRYKYLYRLKCYCVENMLLSDKALMAVGADSSVQTDEEDVLPAIGFEEIRESFRYLLRPLFVVYAAAEALKSGLTTVKYSIERLLERRSIPPRLSRKLVFERIKSLLRAMIRAHGKDLVNRFCRIFRRKFTTSCIFKKISGKHYLLPFIHKVFEKVLHYRGSAEQFKARLALEFQPNIESGFCRTIRSL